jgi:hypothetical protein
VCIEQVENPDGERFHEWACAQFKTLASKIREDEVEPIPCVDFIPVFDKHGFLKTIEGRSFLNVIKDSLYGTLDNGGIDEFEALAHVVDYVPGMLSDDEVREVSSAYTEFIESYVDECDMKPDELRDEAYRVSSIGNSLEVDTERAEEQLRERADAIEARAEEDRDWEPDYEGGGQSEADDVCSDADLDSMFGTLGSEG